MLTTIAERLGDNAVLRLSGVLNARTYGQARDALIKCALDDIEALIIDIDDIVVPDDYAWPVFVNARWQVRHWPQIPIVLACSNSVVRQDLSRLGIARYLPVYDNLAEAAQKVGSGCRDYRRRARTKLVPHESSIPRAQFFVSDHLTAWSMQARIPATVAVATALVENALTHTHHHGCDLGAWRPQPDQTFVAVLHHTR